MLHLHIANTLYAFQPSHCIDCCSFLCFVASRVDSVHKTFAIVVKFTHLLNLRLKSRALASPLLASLLGHRNTAAEYLYLKVIHVTVMHA